LSFIKAKVRGLCSVRVHMVFNYLKVGLVFNCQKVDMVFNRQKANLVFRPIVVRLLRQEYRTINEEFDDT